MARFEDLASVSMSAALVAIALAIVGVFVDVVRRRAWVALVLAALTIGFWAWVIAGIVEPT